MFDHGTVRPPPARAQAPIARESAVEWARTALARNVDWGRHQRTPRGAIQRSSLPAGRSRGNDSFLHQRSPLVSTDAFPLSNSVLHPTRNLEAYLTQAGDRGTFILMSTSNIIISRGSILLLLGLLPTACGSAQGGTVSSASAGAGEETKEEARHANACNTGLATSCSRLGVLFEQGRGVGKDEARAAALYTKACDGGDAEGCFNLGVLLEQGRGVDKDEARAATLFTKACDGGNTAGCSSLAGGVGKDETGTAGFFTKACDRGDAEGCFNLGVLFDQGHRVATDKARAAALYTKACDGGHAPGCVNLYTKACDGGDAEGCFRLGLLFDEGRAVDQDRAHAADLYAKACKGGDASGCTLHKLKTHYATMLSGLTRRHLVACREPAPADAVRTTTSSLRMFAEAPMLPASDLNVRCEPQEMISSPFSHFANATGSSRVKYAGWLLAAPATLVVDVESEVPPTQTMSQKIVSGHYSGIFNPGSLTVRQVRFDSRAKPTCETRVTLKNSNLVVTADSTWVEAASKQLRDQIPLSF